MFLLPSLHEEFFRPSITLAAHTQKGALFSWTSDCDEAFRSLKHALTNPPIEAHPNISLPFLLYTDASQSCLGSLLAQVKNGNELVTAYASHTLTAAQQKWATYDQELWVIIWLVKHFKHLLSGSPFKIITDQKPLLSLTKAQVDNDPTRRRAHWILELDVFDYTILHRDEGRQHANAAAMSRQYSVS